MEVIQIAFFISQGIYRMFWSCTGILTVKRKEESLPKEVGLSLLAFIPPAGLFHILFMLSDPMFSFCVLGFLPARTMCHVHVLLFSAKWKMYQDTNSHVVTLWIARSGALKPLFYYFPSLIMVHKIIYIVCKHYMTSTKLHKCTWWMNLLQWIRMQTMVNPPY